MPIGLDPLYSTTMHFVCLLSSSSIEGSRHLFHAKALIITCLPLVWPNSPLPFLADEDHINVRAGYMNMHDEDS